MIKQVFISSAILLSSVTVNFADGEVNKYWSNLEIGAESSKVVEQSASKADSSPESFGGSGKIGSSANNSVGLKSRVDALEKLVKELSKQVRSNNILTEGIKDSDPEFYRELVGHISSTRRNGVAGIDCTTPYDKIVDHVSYCNVYINNYSREIVKYKLSLYKNGGEEFKINFRGSKVVTLPVGNSGYPKLR